MRYVALLRGINVGGVRIKMADLRDVVSGLGHTEVKTVLASGNILFESPKKSTATLTAGLESALSDHFGYGARVLALPSTQLSAVTDAYPFEDRDGWHSYVIFATAPDLIATTVALADQLDDATERVQPGENVVYWQVQRGDTLDSRIGKHTGKMVPRKPDDPFTTVRNLNTLRKLR